MSSCITIKQYQRMVILETFFSLSFKTSKVSSIYFEGTIQKWNELSLSKYCTRLLRHNSMNITAFTNPTNQSQLMYSVHI